MIGVPYSYKVWRNGLEDQTHDICFILHVYIPLWMRFFQMSVYHHLRNVRKFTFPWYIIYVARSHASMCGALISYLLSCWFINSLSQVYSHGLFWRRGRNEWPLDFKLLQALACNEWWAPNLVKLPFLSPHSRVLNKKILSQSKSLVYIDLLFLLFKCSVKLSQWQY